MTIMSKGCLNCQSSEAINFFNWKHAQKPSDVNYSLINSIVPVGKLKFGEIYQSTCCGTKWYLHNGIFMYVINPLRQVILDEWSSRNLQVPDRFKPILASIGANLKGGMFTINEYPCRVEFKDKTAIDNGLLSLVTLPPDFEEAIYGKRSEEYIYIDEVIDIKKSKFALPVAIRKVTMNPSEIGMGGYMPIPISDAHGKVYKLSPFESFINPKVDEPISALDHQKALTSNPIALQRVPTKRVIADPF